MICIPISSCKSSDDNKVTERIVDLRAISRTSTRAARMEKFNPLILNNNLGPRTGEIAVRNYVDDGQNTRGLIGFILESKVSFAIRDPPFGL